MTVEGLLQPRYKVIAPYPGMNYTVGEIVFSSERPYEGMNEVFFKTYPHLFRLLPWWEERKVEELEPEVWANIEGYEGLYEISTYGRVKSLSRKTIRKHKGVKEYSFVRAEKFLTLQSKSDGYVKVELSKNDVTQVLYPHRLVGKAFVPNPDNKPYINHIKSVRNFNWYKNLEWCTQSENLIHAVNANDYREKIKNRKKPLIHPRSKEGRQEYEQYQSTKQ